MWTWIALLTVKWLAGDQVETICERWRSRYKTVIIKIMIIIIMEMILIIMEMILIMIQSNSG